MLVPYIQFSPSIASFRFSASESAHRRSVLCQSFDSSKSISDLLRMEEGFSFFSFPRLHLAQAGKGWDFYLKMKGAFVGLGIYRVGGHT